MSLTLPRCAVLTPRFSTMVKVSVVKHECLIVPVLLHPGFPVLID